MSEDEQCLDSRLEAWADSTLLQATRDRCSRAVSPQIQWPATQLDC